MLKQYEFHIVFKLLTFCLSEENTLGKYYSLVQQIN